MNYCFSISSYLPETCNRLISILTVNQFPVIRSSTDIIWRLWWLVNSAFSALMNVWHSHLTILNFWYYVTFSPTDLTFQYSEGSFNFVLCFSELGTFADHPTIVHNPRVGERLSLNCTPPASVPDGVIYWVEKPTPHYNAFTRIHTEHTQGRLIVDYTGEGKAQYVALIICNINRL